MSQLSYNYVNIAPQGVSTDQVTGINDLGQVVGSFFGATPSGFVGPGGPAFEYGSGTYTLLPNFSDFPFPVGINDEGQVVGSEQGLLGGASGFLYSGGTFTRVMDPLNPFWFSSTEFTGINDSGQIVGFSDVRGFLYDGSTFTTISDPLAAAGGSHPEGGTVPVGINNAGQIVGYYNDSAGLAHGFLFSNGNYTTLDDPLATGGTFITSINNTGQLVGYYNDASGQHGFLYNDGTFFTLDNPLGVRGTSLTGINDSGQIVGNYLDSSGHSHGFLGTLAFSEAIAGTTVYTKEYGFAPDAAEVNVLVEFTTPQYAYGQQIGVMDPAVYGYEALGVALAGSATHFQNTWGPSNPMYPNSAAGDAQFAADAYASVFGHPGNSAQAQHFVDQLNFVEGLYTAAGVFGSAANIDLLARGAIYGQMLGIEAEINPFGPGGAAGTAEVSIVGVSATSDTVHGVSHTF
jgi:probable HAF family extracellular repeat protein